MLGLCQYVVLTSILKEDSSKNEWIASLVICQKSHWHQRKCIVMHVASVLTKLICFKIIYGPLITQAYLPLKWPLTLCMLVSSMQRAVHQHPRYGESDRTRGHRQGRATSVVKATVPDNHRGAFQGVLTRNHPDGQQEEVSSISFCSSWSEPWTAEW